MVEQGVGYEELKMLITHANYGTLPKFDSLVATHEGNFIRIRRLLEAAVMYQFDAIQDFCVSKMKTMLNISTCLKLMFLADRLGLPDLLLQAKQMCLWRFELVKEDVAFLELPCNLLVEYLSQDGLRTKDESTVFHSVVKWTNHNPEQRLPLMYEAISSVRFSDISLPEMKIIAHLPFVTNNQVVRQLVHEIWKLKFDKYIRERVMRGATSRPISPLSNISPAESVQVLDNWTPTEEDDDDVKVDCLPPISNIATEHIPETYVSEAKLLAKQLLVTRSRVLPMYPAVILRNNDFPVPHILAFNHHEKTIMMLGSLTKACEQSQVALGFTACAKGEEKLDHLVQ